MKRSNRSRPCVVRAILAGLLLINGTFALAQTVPPSRSTRAPWTSGRVKGSPEPPLPYTTERAFPNLTFKQCLDITSVPGSDRLFVVEQSGKIFSFPNRADVKKADLAADIVKGIKGARSVYAIAFDPQFQKNRYCYICYIKAPNLKDGTHIARFTVSRTNPPTIDIATESTILTWLSGGHNGCCLKFGPDGYLYISTGDGAPANPPDTQKSGQDISDLLSSILRIDVNRPEGDRRYRIPADNPFVNHAGARGEIWAYGFRNPWRMSFDKKTGDLWVGDVGWELWEMLDRVQRGGNYGWGVMEGRQSTNPEWPRGPTPILPPTIDHPHSESSSITDGLTYYGKRLKKLHGTHIYGDYDTGKFWGFRYENGRVVGHRELADTTHRVVGFGAGHDGEFFILDHTAGTIHQLVPNPRKPDGNRFPRRLSETGLFADLQKQTPAPGVIAYSINAEPWADHATAQRFVAVPGSGTIKASGRAWQFPPDSVLVKTLSLEMERGRASSRRRIETQILHFDGQEWQPYTYRWNEDQTDASLLDAAGGEQLYKVRDIAAPGGVRDHRWRFSGRAECQRCHNKWSGPALAFNTPQLNRDHEESGTIAPQLETFAQIKLIDKPIGKKNRPRLADPRDSSAEIGARARAYLQANCAHCHRMHAGSAVLSKMHYDLDLRKTNMLGVRPSQGTFGIHAAQVIAPGDAFRSVLFYRMSKLGSGRMPHIGSSQVDQEGCRLIAEWISSLRPDAAKATSADATVKKNRSRDAALLVKLQAATASEARVKTLNSLLESTGGALMVLQALDRNQLAPEVASIVSSKAGKHEDVRIRDLFERFLPASARIKRLGSVVQPGQILALAGDVVRGKAVFFQAAGVQCKTCHRIGKLGKEVGPDLSTIGKKYTRRQILESILQPSKKIDPKYVTYLAETDKGRLLSGLLVKKTAKEVVLRDAQNKLLRIPSDQIEQLVPQRRSLMPELLLRDMTAQQVADLLAYLSALK